MLCSRAHALCWLAPRGDNQTAHAIVLTDSVSLLEKSEQCNPIPRLVRGDVPPSKTELADVLPWTCRSEGISPMSLTSEVLRSLTYYPWAQSQRHHITDRLDERGVERGSARRSSLTGRGVNQTDIGTVSKATLGTFLRDEVERIWAFPNA